MASVATYLNFMGKTEEAFLFYKKVFRSEFTAPITRMSSVPPGPGPKLTEKEQNYVMHVELPILAGHKLQGTDAIESMGALTFGNNVSINLDPDTRADAERIFGELAVGGRITMPLTDMFWGSYFGTLVDPFGVQWMMNCTAKKG